MLYEVITWLLVLACASLLAACGGEQHSDLKDELRQLTKDLRGRVEPLPAVKTYESVPYTAEAEVVITSYSIHYTKLYDLLPARGGCASPNMLPRSSTIFVMK